MPLPHVLTLRDHFELEVFFRLQDARAACAKEPLKRILFYTDAPTEHSPTAKAILVGTDMHAARVWSAVAQGEDLHLHEFIGGRESRNPAFFFLDIDLKVESEEDLIAWRTVVNDALAEVAEYEASEGRNRVPVILTADGYSASKRAWMVSTHVVFGEWTRGCTLQELLTKRVQEWEVNRVGLEMLPYIDMHVSSSMGLRMPGQSKMEEDGFGFPKRVFTVVQGSIPQASITTGVFSPESMAPNLRVEHTPPGSSQNIEMNAKRARVGEEATSMDEVRALAACFERQQLLYDEWLRVGFALVAAGRETGDLAAARSTWVAISRMGGRKYNARFTEEKWHSLCSEASGRVGINTYYFWAEKLNRPEYLRIRAGYHELKSFTPEDLAEFFRALFSFRWVYDQADQWHFCRHDATWCTDATPTRSFLIGDICDFCVDVVDYVEVGGAKDVAKFLKEARGWTMCATVSRQLQRLLLSPGFLSQLDADPGVLNFNNGVLNLRTGGFVPRDISDYISRTCGYDFSPMVDPEEDREVREALQDVFLDPEEYSWGLAKLAMCLYGENFEQVFTFDWGPQAGNGKDTLFNWLYRALGGDSQLGGYGCVLNSESITVKNVNGGGSGPTPDLLALWGARLIYVSEVSRGRPLDEAALKRIASMTSITARAVFGKPITFVVKGHLHILVNLIPEVAHPDGGYRRRFSLTPWNTMFRDQDHADPALRYDAGNERHRLRRPERASVAYLDGHRNALINFLLPVLQGILRNGMPVPPASVARTTAEVLGQQDPINEFIANMCVPAHTLYAWPAKTLFDLYCQQADESYSASWYKYFNQRMREAKFTATRRKKGQFFVGLQVRDPDDPTKFVDPEAYQAKRDGERAAGTVGSAFAPGVHFTHNDGMNPQLPPVVAPPPPPPAPGSDVVESAGEPTQADPSSSLTLD